MRRGYLHAHLCRRGAVATCIARFAASTTTSDVGRPPVVASGSGTDPSPLKRTNPAMPSPRRLVTLWHGPPTTTAPAAAPPKEGDASASQPSQVGEDAVGQLKKNILLMQGRQNAKIKQRLKECLGEDMDDLLVSSSDRLKQHASQANALPSTSASRGGSQRAQQPESASHAALRRISDNRLQVRQMVGEASGVEWWDISSHPTAALEEYRDSIASALVELGAHETLVEATLESVLLPQLTNVEGCQCLVVRCAVEDTSFDMDSIQELTNRLTILLFRNEKRIVTVHRTHLPQVEQLVKRWREEQEEGGAACNIDSLVLHFVKETCRSFHRALAKSIVEFDNYEAKLFAPERRRSSFARQIYHIKRRASVYSRILVLTGDAFSNLVTAMGISNHNVYVQDVVQDLTHVRSLSDELNDNANSVLQLLFQLSSYQLNELMRVLTMFSAFFIPLSFIASVYGMNFDHLPGVTDPNGHWYCLSTMLLVGVSIVLWFKVKQFW